MANKAKKFGSLGSRSEEICTVRRRDIATGRLLPGCAHKVGYVYAPDGTRAKVKVSSCGEDGAPFTYKVISAEIPDDLAAELKHQSKEVRDSFKASWNATIEEELNAAVVAEINNRELHREVRSSIATRAANTREKNRAAALKAGKAPKGTADKSRAKNELEAVKARITAAKAEAQKTKSRTKLEAIKKRLSRLEGARLQLEKIMAGKASKFPSAAALK